jgi:hypothetical protein
MDYKALKIMRYNYNLLLAETILNTIKSDCGEQRFGQILRNYGFVRQVEIQTGGNYGGMNVWIDEFNLEPDQLFKRVLEEYTKVSN